MVEGLHYGEAILSSGKMFTQYSSLPLISTSDLDTLSMAVNDERDDASLRNQI
jgi:hypothetical protein